LYIEKNLLLRYLVKGFSVQKKWEKTISSTLTVKCQGGQISELIKPKGLLIYNPIKQLFAKLKQ